MLSIEKFSLKLLTATFSDFNYIVIQIKLSSGIKFYTAN